MIYPSKSGVRPVPVSDAFCSDVVWKKAVFDPEELLDALAQDRIGELVERILHRDYGTLRTFPQLVHDVRASLLAGLVNVIRRAKGDRELAVLFRHTDVERLERALPRIPTDYPDPVYWVGENCAIAEPSQRG